MSLWSPCGLYANLPYGYPNPTASTNFINPTYNGISVNNLPYDDGGSANLNDLATSDNYTGISDSPVNQPYSSVVTSSQSREPTFKLTTESTDDQTIDTNLSIKNVITANSSLSKR